MEWFVGGDLWCKTWTNWQWWLLLLLDGLHFHGVSIINEVVKDLYKYGLKEGGKLFLAGSRWVVRLLLSLKVGQIYKNSNFKIFFWCTLLQGFNVLDWIWIFHFYTLSFVSSIFRHIFQDLSAINQRQGSRLYPSSLCVKVRFFGNSCNITEVIFA